jgi:hypothetical protein
VFFLHELWRKDYRTDQFTVTAWEVNAPHRSSVDLDGSNTQKIRYSRGDRSSARAGIDGVRLC